MLLFWFWRNVKHILLHLYNLFPVVSQDHSDCYKKRQDNEYQKGWAFYQLKYEKIFFHYGQYRNRLTYKISKQIHTKQIFLNENNTDVNCF